MKYCLKCNVEIEDDSKFCPICGSKQETEERKCIDCGTVLSKEVLFCPKCGTKQNDSYAIKLEVYNILKDAVEKLAKTKEVKTVSYLNATKKQLSIFKETCINSKLYDQKEFSEEDFVFAISKPSITKNDNHLLFMTYGIKDYLSEARYEWEYKDIKYVDSFSYSNSIYLELKDPQSFRGASVRFGIDFQNYNGNIKYEWKEILEKLIDLGKSHQPDDENNEDDEYKYNSDDYEDDSYNSENYDSDDYNSYESEKNYSSPIETKENMLFIVSDYKNKISDTPFVFYSFKNLPDKNKNNMLKMAKNISFDDFVCMIDTSIMGSGKEGLIFTLTGIYEHIGPFSGSNYFSYKDIKNMKIESKKDLCIIFNEDIDDGIFKNTNYMNISVSYFAEPLKELITKLIGIYRSFENNSYSNSKSGRVKGYFSGGNRKAFFEGQKDGYKRCSQQYEIKLRRQAELFLKTTNKWRRERDEYEALLDEYDATIVELEAKLAETESPEYRQRLNNVSNYRDQLAALSY